MWPLSSLWALFTGQKDLLGRVEEVVVQFGRSADVREIGAEEEPQLGQDGTAEHRASGPAPPSGG